MGFQTTSPIACEHAVPFSGTCPQCVIAAWDAILPSRVNHPTQAERETRAETRAEDATEARAFDDADRYDDGSDHHYPRAA